MKTVCLKEDSGKLPVVELFNSIQGEGLHTGKPAFFVRLGGCDVCCTWCDEKPSWDKSLFPLVHTNEIVKQIIESSANTVVVTGGEPFIHQLTTLTRILKKQQLLCMAETSGTEIINGFWDWITMSPKKQHPPLKENYSKANELKVIIQNEDDLLWAEHNSQQVSSHVVLYLQPEWSVFNEILPTLIRYIKTHPKWRLSVQVHKFLNIP
jgi:7-carboxy-7-deazaguanine synthase